ncbi:uncharacterized protein LOC144769584 [Lissotriton helveticus]
MGLHPAVLCLLASLLLYATAAKDCTYMGKTYKDGETIETDCEICECTNGEAKYCERKESCNSKRRRSLSEDALKINYLDEPGVIESSFHRKKRALSPDLEEEFIDNIQNGKGKGVVNVKSKSSKVITGTNQVIKTVKKIEMVQSHVADSNENEEKRIQEELVKAAAQRNMNVEIKIEKHGQSSGKKILDMSHINLNSHNDGSDEKDKLPRKDGSKEDSEEDSKGDKKPGSHYDESKKHSIEHKKPGSHEDESEEHGKEHKKLGSHEDESGEHGKANKKTGSHEDESKEHGKEHKKSGSHEEESEEHSKEHKKPGSHEDESEEQGKEHKMPGSHEDKSEEHGKENKKPGSHEDNSKEHGKEHKKPGSHEDESKEHDNEHKKSDSHEESEKHSKEHKKPGSHEEESEEHSKEHKKPGSHEEESEEHVKEHKKPGSHEDESEEHVKEHKKPGSHEDESEEHVKEHKKPGSHEDESKEHSKEHKKPGSHEDESEEHVKEHKKPGSHEDESEEHIKEHKKPGSHEDESEEHVKEHKKPGSHEDESEEHIKEHKKPGSHEDESDSDEGENTPENEDGCLFNHASMEDGESTKLRCLECTCKSGAVSCVRDFQCPGICSVSGYQMIRTFDGSLFDSPGSCSYMLVKTSNFAIFLHNTQCEENEKAICIQAVEVHITPQMKVKLLADGSVLTDNGVIDLPIHTNEFITIRKSSSVFMEVVSTLGFALHYDFKGHRVYVIMDTARKEDTKGLCGTFNDNRNDDYISSNGMLESVAAMFSVSWKMDQSCTEQPKGDPDLDVMVSAKDKCDGYLDESIFADCRTIIDITGYKESCASSIYFGEEFGGMCSALADYAYHCGFAGITVPFRSTFSDCEINCQDPLIPATLSEFSNRDCREYTDQLLVFPAESMLNEVCVCPSNQYYDSTLDTCVDGDQCPCYANNRVYKLGEMVKFQNGKECGCQRIMECSDENIPTPSVIEACPDGEVYSDCSNGVGKSCEKSCLNLEMIDQACPAECVPGCICPYGSYRDDEDQCVSISECKCIHGGDKYNPGETMVQDCNACTCKDGRFECTRNACTSVCNAYGESQFILFDKVWKKFPTVDCTMMLVMSAENPPFAVGATSVASKLLAGSYSTKNITIQFGDTYVLLTEFEPQVMYNPAASHHNEVNIYRAGFYTVVDFPEGLTVYYDLHLDVVIQLQPHLQGKVEGMCGDADGTTTYEFSRGNMLQYGSQFLAAGCPYEKPLPPPSGNHTIFVEERCSLLKSDVFFPCHSVVSVDSYYSACVEETASCIEGESCLCFCTAVAAYARACCRQGISIDWRTADTCPAPCEYYNREAGEGPYHLTNMNQLRLVADFESGQVILSPADDNEDLKASFMVTPGLYKDIHSIRPPISLESALYPNYFIVQDEDGSVHLEKWQSSVTFRKRATFIWRKNRWSRGYDALESFTQRGYYLTAGSDNSLSVTKYIKRSTQDASFKLTMESFGLPFFSMCLWRYKSCEPPCIKTCQDPYGTKCSLSLNVEGCFPHCAEGLVFDEKTHRCVQYKNCINEPTPLPPFTPVTSPTTPDKCKGATCRLPDCKVGAIPRKTEPRTDPCCDKYICECETCPTPQVCGFGLVAKPHHEPENECCASYTCECDTCPATPDCQPGFHLQTSLEQKNPCCVHRECVPEPTFVRNVLILHSATKGLSSGKSPDQTIPAVRCTTAIVSPPPIPVTQKLCSDLSNFFIDKIEKIQESIDTKHQEVENGFVNTNTDIRTTFQCIGQDQLLDYLNIIKSGSTNDVCPPEVQKSIFKAFPKITLSLLNLSLTQGTVPQAFKEAVIIPLQKKQGVDPQRPNNIRPISLLPFSAEVLETHIAKTLSSFIEKTNFLDPHQAGFRAALSKESIILSVMDNLKEKADVDSTQALILLDMSAAFDTVNQNILVDRLTAAGLSGTALIIINECPPTCPTPEDCEFGWVLSKVETENVCCEEFECGSASNTYTYSIQPPCTGITCAPPPTCQRTGESPVEIPAEEGFGFGSGSGSGSDDHDCCSDYSCGKALSTNWPCAQNVYRVLHLRSVKGDFTSKYRSTLSLSVVPITDVGPCQGVICRSPPQCKRVGETAIEDWSEGSGKENCCPEYKCDFMKLIQFETDQQTYEGTPNKIWSVSASKVTSSFFDFQSLCNHVTCTVKACKPHEKLVQRPTPPQACCPVYDCECQCDSVPTCGSDERLVPVHQVNQCCPRLKCEKKKDECHTVPKAVQLVQGECEATVQLQTCRGYCHSSTEYSHRWEPVPHCQCCSVKRTQTKTFEIPCPNGKKTTLVVKEAVACSCQSCSGEEDGSGEGSSSSSEEESNESSEEHGGVSGKSHSLVWKYIKKTNN